MFIITRKFLLQKEKTIDEFVQVLLTNNNYVGTMLSPTRTTSIMKYDLVYCRVLAVGYKTRQSFCLSVLFYFF